MNPYEDAFPDVFRLEASGKCNFTCRHCPTGRSENGRGILKNDAFSMLFEQFSRENYIPRVAVLYHGGEPLLNKHLASYIAQLKELGVQKTVITTNASLLTEQKAKNLIDAGLDELKVSFDGDSPDENNRIRGGGDFFSDAENVKRLLEIRAFMGRETPRVLISNVRIVTNATLCELTADGSFESPPAYLTQFFENYPVSFQSYPAMVWPGIPQNEVEYFHLPENKVDYCSSMFETITVMANGDVVACCYDLTGSTIFGNIFDESVFEIWKRNTFRKFRDDFRCGVYVKPCSECLVVTPRYLKSL